MAANSPGFLLQIYQDERQAMALIRQIRRLYPAAPIAIIADGCDPAGFEDFASQCRATYLIGDRLKLIHHGGRWLQRQLQAAAKLPADPIIKLDPDSWVWRQFSHYSEADIAGTMVGRVGQKIEIIRGGCVAYRQRAIATILDSGFLEDACYRNPAYYAYARYGEYRQAGERAAEDMIASEDCIRGHIAKRLQLWQEDWSECRIAFREEPPANDDLQWAVTHPRRIAPPTLPELGMLTPELIESFRSGAGVIHP